MMHTIKRQMRNRRRMNVCLSFCANVFVHIEDDFETV